MKADPRFARPVSHLRWRHGRWLVMDTALATIAILASSAVTSGGDWPQFLGPNGTLTSSDPQMPPLQWSDTENVLWKTALPGRGVSSPIVIGDKVFVTCYSGYGTGGENETMEKLTRHVVCVARDSGEVLWQKDFAARLPEDPYQPPGVTAHGYASNTPVSDCTHVYAFLGKSGVVALDMAGNLVWQAELGDGSGPMRWGSAASPVLMNELLIVPAIEEAEAIVALDKMTGKEVWRSEAESLQATWSTPIIATVDGKTEIVLSVPGEVWGLNPENGKLRWYSRGTTDTSASASLVLGDTMVYATGGRGGDAVAVKLGGKGDVNDTHIVWDNNVPGRFATPVLHDSHLYTFAGGVAACYDATTGERVGQQRLGESQARDASRRPGDGASASDGTGGTRRSGGMGNQDYASPVLAGDRLYVTTKSGTVFVLKATPELEILATNRIADSSGFDGTPAISNGALFLRSGSHLYCIAETK